MNIHELIAYCRHCDTLVPEDLTANCSECRDPRRRVVCHDCAKYDSKLDDWVCPECAEWRKKQVA